MKVAPLAVLMKPNPPVGHLFAPVQAGTPATFPIVAGDDGEPEGFDISSRLRTLVKFMRTVNLSGCTSPNWNTRPTLNDAEGRR